MTEQLDLSGMDPEFDLTEFLDVVHYEVESKHGVLGTQCRCGFESFVKRDHTKHIVTETLIAAGLEASDADDN